MSIHKLLFCEKNKEKVEIGGVFMRQADVEFTVRTDLALEEREKVQGSEIPGIRVREWEKEETGIRVTEVAVCDERGEKALGKPVGMYLTVEAASLAKKDDDYHREVSEELAGLLRGMLKEHGLETEKMGRPVRTLVVGLGNPGEEYEHTRHNAGFDAVDLIAEEVGARYWKTECGIWSWSMGRIFAGSTGIRS